MSFPSLVSGGAECGPSNAMTGLVKNFSRDRSLQQVFFSLHAFACMHTVSSQSFFFNSPCFFAAGLVNLPSSRPLFLTLTDSEIFPAFSFIHPNLFVGSRITYRIASHQVLTMPEAVLRDSEPAVQGSSMEVIRYSNYIATDKQTDSTAE